MGLWDDLKKAVQQTGEQALKKADAAMNAVQKSMETHEANHQANMDAQIGNFMAADPSQMTPEQLAQLRKFAFKTGKLDKPGNPPQP